MDLSDPDTFRRVFDEHERGVYAAALRVLGNAAQAQDVVQDVFLRLWRRPGAFDAHRGEIGAYLRLMARSRALDLWREGQAAGRATDRLKLVVARREERAGGEPRGRRGARRRPRGPRASPAAAPEPQREALVLAYWGGLTAGQIADARAGAARHRQEPHPARAGASCARSALHWRTTPRRSLR